MGPAGGYSNILKENPTFEAYYKAQKIVSSEEEWQQFIETMKKPLPSDFRISSLCTGQAELMRQRILNLTKLSNSSASNEADGQQQEEQKPAEDGNEEREKKKKYTHFKSEFVVSPMPWYPNRLGWTINLSKIEIRKSEALNKLHHFLISETATVSFRFFCLMIYSNLKFFTLGRHQPTGSRIDDSTTVASSETRPLCP